MKPAQSNVPVKVSHVARTLGVSPQTVRNWIRRIGIVPIATPLVQCTEMRDNKYGALKAKWAILPDDARRLMLAIRSK